MHPVAARRWWARPGCSCTLPSTWSCPARARWPSQAPPWPGRRSRVIRLRLHKLAARVRAGASLVLPPARLVPSDRCLPSHRRAGRRVRTTRPQPLSLIGPRSGLTARFVDQSGQCQRAQVSTHMGCAGCPEARRGSTRIRLAHWQMPPRRPEATQWPTDSGQRADRRITGGADGARLGLRAVGWLLVDIWGVTSARRY
jgi:hypothetical protein